MKDVAPAWATLPVSAGAASAISRPCVAWSERSGSMRSPRAEFALAVIGREGELCQAKRLLSDAQGFTYDDLVAKPDGSGGWANAFDGQVHIMTLQPAS
jgi:hypothetical protein